MSFGYWIELGLLALNPFTTFEKVFRLIAKYRAEPGHANQHIGPTEFEELVTSGMRRTEGRAMDPLRWYLSRGRAFGHKAVHVIRDFDYSGLSTCVIMGSGYQVRAVVVLGSRVLYDKPIEVNDLRSSFGPRV